MAVTLSFANGVIPITGCRGGRARGLQLSPGIVLISSASGQRGEARLGDYGASKGAIIRLTKSLAAELASFDIYVN